MAIRDRSFTLRDIASEDEERGDGQRQRGWIDRNHVHFYYQG